VFLALAIGAAFAVLAQTAHADVYDITLTSLEGSYLETRNALVGSPLLGSSITLVDALSSAREATECGVHTYGVNLAFGLPAASGRLHMKRVAQLDGLPV
jgi:hypothetical protein